MIEINKKTEMKSGKTFVLCEFFADNVT